MRRRTVEEIGNPDVYIDMFSEMVCQNPWIRQGKTEDIREEDDCLRPLRGTIWRWSKVVLAFHGALGLTREDEALVAIRTSHV
jgi:hypothetical protein